jgi:copper(I)-binding protein
VLAVLAAPALLGGCGSGSDSDGASVTVRDAWARTTPAGASTGAVYFLAESEEDDTLEAAVVDSSIAASAAVHMTMAAADGTSVMHDMGPLFLPAGEEVVFDPNGTHVMLVDLAAPLAAGESFDVTLQFAEAPDVVVPVTVADEAP